MKICIKILFQIGNYNILQHSILENPSVTLQGCLGTIKLH